MITIMYYNMPKKKKTQIIPSNMTSSITRHRVLSSILRQPHDISKQIIGIFLHFPIPNIHKSFNSK